MIQMLVSNLPMVLCLLMGMALVILEVFLPGFGLPGISGIVLIGAGVIIAGVNFGAVTAVGLLLVLVAVLAVLITWVLHHVTRGGGHPDLFLRDTQELSAQEDMQAFVGREGVAKGPLRPAGIGEFDGVRLNVVTEGGYIDGGKPICITRIDGNRIIVRASQAESA